MSFKYEVTIKEVHLDSYGHVNNATYLALYEEARWELITQRGYGYKQVHENQKGPVILDINVKFFKELKLREKIYITVETLSYEGRFSKIKQQMIKQDGSVASEFLMTAAFFDLKARKIIDPSPEWLKALGL